MKKTSTVFGQPAEETIGSDIIRLALGIAEVLPRTLHSVLLCFARVETRQTVSEGADGLQLLLRTTKGGADGVAIVDVAGNFLRQIGTDGTEHTHVARFVNQDSIARLCMENPVEVFLRKPIL